MRKLLFLYLILSGCLSFAQPTDNNVFVKLYVVNDKKEIMLVKWHGDWEIPGMSYNTPRTISTFLDTMAAGCGITVKDKKFAAQLTFQYSTRKHLTLMTYYKVHHADGELKVPEDCTDIKWFSVKEALKVIPYPEMCAIIEKINEKNGVGWGGAVKKTKNPETGKTDVEFIEPIYKLN